MTSDIFTSWFTIFLTQVKERPLLLIFDGHRTHATLEIIKLAQSNNFTLLKLPSHTTDILQPLDVACFRPLKCYWDKRVIAFQKENDFHYLAKSDYVDLLCDVWFQGLSVQNIQTGFRSTGIFPVDRSKYPLAKFNCVKMASYTSYHTIQHDAGNPNIAVEGHGNTTSLSFCSIPVPVQQSTSLPVSPVTAINIGASGDSSSSV
jgi:hypothetical protein